MLRYRAPGTEQLLFQIGHKISKDIIFRINFVSCFFLILPFQLENSLQEHFQNPYERVKCYKSVWEAEGQLCSSPPAQNFTSVFSIYPATLTVLEGAAVRKNSDSKCKSRKLKSCKKRILGLFLKTGTFLLSISLQAHTTH